jgi:hypothetical protein
MTTESAPRRRVAVDKNLAQVGKHIRSVGCVTGTRPDQLTFG